MQTRQWDAPDGSKRYRTEIVLDQFIPLTPKGGAYEIGIDAHDAGATDSTPVAPEKKSTKSDKTVTPVVPSSDEDINLDDIPF